MTANELIMKVAFSQLATTEIIGKNDNPSVIRYFHEIGHTWVKHDEVAWCAAFWNWVCLKSFCEKTGKLNAQSFLEVGTHINPIDAKFGDTVVLWRDSPTSWKGHVGGFVGWSKDRRFVYLIGGNQSNQVNIKRYLSKKIKGIRRLESKIVL